MSYDAMRLLHNLIKCARAVGREDEWVQVTSHSRGRMGGKAFARVQLYTVTSDGLDGLEVDHFVIRNGNPDEVVLHTTAQDEAERRYEHEVKLADERERRWLEDYADARR